MKRHAIGSISLEHATLQRRLSTDAGIKLTIKRRVCQRSRRFKSGLPSDSKSV